MKKGQLLLLLCLFIPACAFSMVGKQLKSITIDEGSNTDQIELSYDEQGRIIQHVRTRNSSENDVINITSSYRGYNITYVDSYQCKLENGRIVSIFGSIENGTTTENYTYSYENDYLVKISNNNMRGEVCDGIWIWNGGNPISYTYYAYYYGSYIDHSSESKFSDIVTEPILHALFGLGCYVDEATVDIVDAGVSFVLYPYIGTLPANLMSEMVFSEDRVSTYSYEYEKNSVGDIVKVRKIGSYETKVYSLEWEGSAVNPPVSSFTIGNFTYRILDDNESVSVESASIDISGNVSIPAMVRNEGSTYSVSEIAENGFAGCSWMTTITIPDGLTTIRDYAFSGCNNLIEIRINSEDPPTVNASAFDGVDKTKCLLRVPAGCGDKYRNAPVWKDFWMVAAEDDIIVNGITYEVNEDGTATILSANRSAEDEYVVPSSVIINGVEYIVTEIGANAFNGCKDMSSVTIPETIELIGDHAFAGCENLLEIYVEGKKPAGMKNAFARSITQGTKRKASQFDGIDYDTCILYVPFGYESLYREADGWREFKNIVGLHGDTDPSITVTAISYTREYGDANPEFEFISEGTTLDGSPEIICEATATSPVGNYSIVVKKGGVKNYNDEYVNGVLTITKAPLIVTVTNATREQFEDNPEFVITYSGWKNGEDESVLIHKPMVVTDATKDSEIGEYVISVSGGEAQNYEFQYVNGVLTVTESTGINDFVASGRSFNVYNLQGRRVIHHKSTSLDNLPKGVYIINGKKMVK